MMLSAVYGRLGADPIERRTRDDKTWATASLALDIDQEPDAAPLWIGIVAFGRVADDLLRHAKGDLISVAGRVQLNRWNDRRTGERREQLQIVADSLISARTVRPSAGRRREGSRLEPAGGAT